MKRVSAKSVSEVMQIVADARKDWRIPEDAELWFRGEDQKHKATTLQPKLYRHMPNSVRLASISLLRQEQTFYDEFARRGLELYGREADRWDWYFLMQHYSAPTRLLDWTDGAMMALHFATNGDLSSSQGGYLYILDPFWLVDELDKSPHLKTVKANWKSFRKYRNHKGLSSPGPWDTVYLPGRNRLRKRSHKPALPKVPLVLDFALMTRRVSAQHSRLIVMGTDRLWLRDCARKRDARIIQIEIPKKRLRAIKVNLRDTGVSESAIFPDLDGLGRELCQLWDLIKGQKQFNK